MTIQGAITAENVYQKIAAVQAALSKTGISKSRKNAQQGYQFRGIDEVYGALAPLLAEHRLNIIPRMLARDVTERQTKSGGAIFNVVVEAEFDFVSADDGSIHVARTFGEAMDNADKATNKAMSAAYKYAALMTFAIPTEGDNDADATTHDVYVKQEAPAVLDDAQWAEITALVQATQTDLGKFCGAYSIDSLKALPSAAFPKAKAQLERKLAQMVQA